MVKQGLFFLFLFCLEMNSGYASNGPIDMKKFGYQLLESSEELEDNEEKEFLNVARKLPPISSCITQTQQHECPPAPRMKRLVKYDPSYLDLNGNTQPLPPMTRSSPIDIPRANPKRLGLTQAQQNLRILTDFKPSELSLNITPASRTVLEIDIMMDFDREIPLFYFKKKMYLSEFSDLKELVLKSSFLDHLRVLKVTPYVEIFDKKNGLKSKISEFKIQFKQKEDTIAFENPGNVFWVLSQTHLADLSGSWNYQNFEVLYHLEMKTSGDVGDLIDFVIPMRLSNAREAY